LRLQLKGVIPMAIISRLLVNAAELKAPPAAHGPILGRMQSARDTKKRQRALAAIACLTAFGLLAAIVLYFPSRRPEGKSRQEEIYSKAQPPTDFRAGMARATLERVFGQMPLHFIENRGQVDPRVVYYIQGRDTTIYFTKEGITFVLTDTKSPNSVRKGNFERTSFPLRAERDTEARNRWVVKLDFVGANPKPEMSAADRTSAVISYFKGPREAWRTGLPTYGSIVYADLWPGIDLVYSGTPNRLKYTFLVQPGADPRQIRLAYSGIAGLRLNAAGQLEVATPFGEFTDDRPDAHQEVDGRPTSKPVAYALKRPSSGEPVAYGFELGPYDTSRPLVIDPAVLVYAGFIGGASLDEGYAVAADSSGNAYVAGGTFSPPPTFPATVGPDVTHNGDEDAFVAKIDLNGSALEYAGYIGGSDRDEGRGIAVDAAGNAYLAGLTSSNQSTFPVVIGPDLTHNGAMDGFVVKVNSAGTALDYAGYIGGNANDSASGIAVDGTGSAYVTGSADSTEATFQVVVGPDLTSNGGTDGFVAKVNSTGTAFDYAGYIGGNSSDFGRGIAVDGLGNAYLAGQTTSTESTFPVMVGPDLTHNGSFDAYVAKVSAGGAALDYAGYIGGNNGDAGHAIAVDGFGNAFITGRTESSEATFPVTVGPDLTHNGMRDVFVAKVNSVGTGLNYAGYIGGSNQDEGLGIALDGSGNAYVVGYTTSTETSFPVTGGPDLTFNGIIDAFVAKVDMVGAALDYAGYIGGSDSDECFGVAVDGAGNAYVVGRTSSSEATFPAALGPDLTYNGGRDAFVAKIAEASPCTPGGTDDGNPCTVDSCDSSSGTVSHVPGNAGAECRAGSGVCDPAEVCDGSSAACPDDAKAPSTTSCDDSNACTTSDHCDGSGACTGGVALNVDDGNPCTVDTCDSSSGAVHTPGNAGAVCRASSGECDVAESCTGSSSACPTDQFVSNGTECTDDGNACSADVCSNGSCSHPVDPHCAGCVGNSPPVVAPPAANPSAPIPYSTSGASVTITANYADLNTGPHTCVIAWGDGTTSPPSGSVTVTEPIGANPGTCSGSHTYPPATNVYEVTVTVTDDCGASGSSVYQYVVVYDPNGGFVTGGGWINSPAGAYAPDPVLTGAANFGFVSKYQKGSSTIPTGETQFHFNAAGFKFDSDAYEWLVISGPKARYRGTGSVNGVAGYGFELTAWDGQISGGGGVDRFRIKIWQGSPGIVIYDNERTSPDGADPVTALQGGSIVVHKK
jgi:hypothetical protein